MIEDTARRVQTSQDYPLLPIFFVFFHILQIGQKLKKLLLCEPSTKILIKLMNKGLYLFLILLMEVVYSYPCSTIQDNYIHKLNEVVSCLKAEIPVYFFFIPLIYLF
jgi:hypothetical protein